MRYVVSRINLHSEEMTYRNYIADSIWYYNQNPRQYIAQRFSEILNPKKEEEKSVDDVLQELQDAGIVITGVNHESNESGGEIIA